jgi:hypothetical protein
VSAASLQVHRVRCVPLLVSSPVAVAFSPSGVRLAVLRDDGSLELWNRQNNFALESVSRAGTRHHHANRNTRQCGAGELAVLCCIA